MTSNTQGVEFLRNPSVNKATAYTETEKQSLGLVGLVPTSPKPSTLSFPGFSGSSSKRALTSNATSISVKYDQKYRAGVVQWQETGAS